MELKDNLIGLEHVGVPTKDLAKTIAFYESLGFEVALRTAVPDGGKVAFLQLGNVMIETYESDERRASPAPSTTWPSRRATSRPRSRR